MIKHSDFEKVITESLKDLANFMIEDLKKELQEQGHIMTGALRDSIELTQLRISQGSQEAFVSLQNYYEVLDKGIPASRIPFNPGSGRKRSLYIEGLIKFWTIKRGLSNEEATRAAFATAHKHKKEGMPTQSSWKSSTNGRRLEFFTRTLNSNIHSESFENSLQDQLELLSDQIIDEFKISIK